MNQEDKIESKQIPFAYSFNLESPNQLVEIMTEEGKRIISIRITI